MYTYNATTSSQDTTSKVAVILTTDVNRADWGIMTTWTWLGMTFIPPQPDWWQVRNLQFMYSANTNASSTTEIQIDQVQMWIYRYEGLP